MNLFYVMKFTFLKTKRCSLWGTFFRNGAQMLHFEGIWESQSVKKSGTEDGGHFIEMMGLIENLFCVSHKTFITLSLNKQAFIIYMVIFHPQVGL